MQNTTSIHSKMVVKKEPRITTFSDFWELVKAAKREMLVGISAFE